MRRSASNSRGPYGLSRRATTHTYICYTYMGYLAMYIAQVPPTKSRCKHIHFTTRLTRKTSFKLNATTYNKKISDVKSRTTSSCTERICGCTVLPATVRYLSQATVVPVASTL